LLVPCSGIRSSIAREGEQEVTVKALLISVLSASLVLPLALDVSAQTRTDTAPKAERQAWAKPDGVMETRKLIGARIKDTAGKDLGEIDQLLVNQNDGKVSHVVVGVGGLAGIGETHVVVPWSDVKVRWERDNAVVSMDRAALDKAPRYEVKGPTRDRAPAASPSTAPRPEPRRSN
jgi:sporulation protein YlmC with PRC-barrel domain